MNNNLILVHLGSYCMLLLYFLLVDAMINDQWLDASSPVFRLHVALKNVWKNMNKQFHCYRNMARTWRSDLQTVGVYGSFRRNVSIFGAENPFNLGFTINLSRSAGTGGLGFPAGHFTSGKSTNIIQFSCHDHEIPSFLTQWWIQGQPVMEVS